MTVELLAPRPSQMKPGNRIAWQAGVTERSGTIWSVGRDATSVWAIPDGPYGSRKPVLVLWSDDGSGFYEQS